MAKKQTISKRIAVLYHDDCADGFGAAWVLWKKFGSRATYLPIRHQAPPPRGLFGKTLYFVDFVYPEQTMKDVVRKSVRTVVLDHHVPMESAAALAHEYCVDGSHSAAVLAWKHFFSKRRMPTLLRYVEATDLWKFNLPYTKEFSASVSLEPYEFFAWNRMARELETLAGRKKHRERGAVLLRYQDEEIVRLIREYAVKVRFAGHTVLAVNSPLFDSALGNALARTHPPFGIVWRVMGKRIRVSLRSLGSFDVAKVAARYGGGGHRNSAGFKLPADAQLPWKMLR